MVPVMIGEDRSMTVPQGRVVKTAYVPIDRVYLGNRSRMGVGDVERAMQRRMAASPGQPWPCPVGEWDGDRFRIADGRHEYVAALMLGDQFILVAWIIAEET